MGASKLSDPLVQTPKSLTTIPVRPRCIPSMKLGNDKQKRSTVEGLRQVSDSVPRSEAFVVPIKAWQQRGLTTQVKVELSALGPERLQSYIRRADMAKASWLLRFYLVACMRV